MGGEQSHTCASHRARVWFYSSKKLTEEKNDLIRLCRASSKIEKGLCRAGFFVLMVFCLSEKWNFKKAQTDEMSLIMDEVFD